MKIFTIKRISFKLNGIFGTIEDEREVFAVTCENPALHIPKGEYVCKKRHYEHGNYDTYEVTNVVGRTDILIHKGNWDIDSKGCILVGESFGVLKGRTAIEDSAGGFNEFLSRTGGDDSFKLVILECSMI